MSEKTDNINVFLNSFRGKLIGAISAGLLMVLIGWKDDIIAKFDAGQVLLEQQEYDNKLDEALIVRFNDHKFMGKLMNSPYMLNYKKKERESAIEDIKHQDSTKLKMSAYISSGTGMDKRAMMDTLKSIILIHNKGAAINNSQCIRNSKEYCRGRSTHQLTRN